MESAEVQYIENPKEQKAVNKVSSLIEFGKRLDAFEEEWIAISSVCLMKSEFERLRYYIKMDLRDARAELCEIRGD